MIIVLFVACLFLGIIAYNYWQIFRQRREGLNLKNDIPNIPNSPKFKNNSFTNQPLDPEKLLEHRKEIYAIEEKEKQANQSNSESSLQKIKRAPPTLDLSNPPSLKTLKENAKKQKPQYKLKGPVKNLANSSKDELNRKTPEITKQSNRLDSAKNIASSGMSGSKELYK